MSNVTYNVHGLLHLAGDCAKFGKLDSFSAFKFESYLGKLKRKLRTKSVDIEFAKPVQSSNQFHQANFPSFTIVAGRMGADCVILNQNQAVKVICFVGEDKFLGEKVEDMTEFYDKPRSLKDLHNIFLGAFSVKVTEFSNVDITGKMVYLPSLDEIFYFVPLIHSVTRIK